MPEMRECCSVRTRSNFWNKPAHLVVRDAQAVVDDLDLHVACPPAGARAPATEPPPGEYLTAFEIRLVRTCRRRSGSAVTMGESGRHVEAHRMVRAAARDRVQDEGAQVDLAPVVGEVARLHLRDEEGVVGQAGQVVRLVDDRLHELLAVLDADVGVLQHHLREAADGHERAAEVVRHHGHELALQPVELLQARLALLSCSCRRWFSTATLAWPATSCSVRQVLVAEGPVAGPVGHRQQADDLGSGQDGRHQQRPHAGVRDEARDEARIGGGLVGQQRRR